MFLFDKLKNKKYLSKKILGSKQTYIELHNKYKDNKSLITKEIENKTGFNLNNIFFEELAFHTQVVIKKSDLNYQHGKILYSILREYVQNSNLNFYNIFETGTARGFSSICMSRALIDANTNGKIYTVDILPHDTKMYWNCIDDHDGMKSRKELLKNWSKETDNIVFINDSSTNFIKKFHIDRIHFAFLDAEHKFNNVIEEFKYVEKKQLSGDSIFFDDVTPELFPGVVDAVKFIEKEFDYKVQYYISSKQRGYALAIKM